MMTAAVLPSIPDSKHANPFKAGSLGWFAAHELGLAWRDFIAMMTAGGRYKQRNVFIFIAIACASLHLIAYGVISPIPKAAVGRNVSTFAYVGATLALAFSLMMSQALEMVTRVFYSRSDLDLILSSPVSIKRHFAVRVGAIAFSAGLLSTLLFGPALNVMAFMYGVGWLGGYVVILSSGLLATAISLAITIGLFKVVGARKTRLISQIIAAVVGASFVIGIQLAGITFFGSLSRNELFTSDLFLSQMPAIASAWWLPTRAIMGEIAPLLTVLFSALFGLALAIQVFSLKFGERVLAASNIPAAKRRQKSGTSFAHTRSISAHLRAKEWRLLLRDHWLISQTLMQILYLLPPAYMLYLGFGSAGAANVVIVPVIVMASGQLAGGLAWLAISGEDAPDLVATAPVSPFALTRAKIEAVLIAIAVVVSPLLLGLALLDWQLAIIAAVFVALATAAATLIQLWFRAQAKRSNFRRRQTSSKVATLAEAFSSILIAGSAALVAVGSNLWIGLMAMAVIILMFARSARPKS